MQPVLNEFTATSAGDVIKNMPFPRTGPMPGIWWMDQYGTNLGAIPGNYSEYYFPMAAPEILLTLDAALPVPSPDPRYEECYYPVGSGGVSKNASWTFINTDGEGSNSYQPLQLLTAASPFTGMQFCMSHNKSRITFLNESSALMYLEKTDWGWSRTTLWPAAIATPLLSRVVAKLMSWFWPCLWGTPTPDYSRPFHYPVFQVVDENGTPTKHLQAALDLIGKRVPCKRSWFSWLRRVSFSLRPNVLGEGNYCNEGPGTLLWVPPMATPPGPPCRPFCNETGQLPAANGSGAPPLAANQSAANASGAGTASQNITGSAGQR